MRRVVRGVALVAVLSTLAFAPVPSQPFALESEAASPPLLGPFLAGFDPVGAAGARVSAFRGALARAAASPVLAAARAKNPRLAAGKLIEVSVRTQRMIVWEDGRIVMRFPVSTAMPGYWTPRGHYRVRSKARNGWSRQWQVVMPWMLQWNGNYTIHQVTHARGSTRLFGVSQLGRPASHGCIRVGVGNAERLYHWAKVGTPVWVH